MYTVYMHTAPNGKVYIGITCNSVTKRWKNGKGYIECPLFYNAILKYGWDNIKHEILYENLTEEQAKRIEKLEIKERKSNNREYGYNITEGGDGCSGYKHSEEAKQKMREHHYDCKGKNNPMYGTKMSEEHKQMLINLHLGSHPSEETREKLRKAAAGRKLPKSFVKYGKDNYSYGRKGRLSPVAKPINQLSEDEEIIKQWDCIAEAARELNISRSGIDNALKKGCRCHGFYWEYTKS